MSHPEFEFDEDDAERLALDAELRRLEAAHAHSVAQGEPSGIARAQAAIDEYHQRMRDRKAALDSAAGKQAELYRVAKVIEGELPKGATIEQKSAVLAHVIAARDGDIVGMSDTELRVLLLDVSVAADARRELTPELRRLGVDPSKFFSWLAPVLGEYRFERREKERTPKRSEEAKQALKLATDALDVLSNAKHQPTRVRALVQRAIVNADADLPARMQRDLTLYAQLLQAAAKLLKQPDRAGRRQATARDAFLDAVRSKLIECGVGTAAAGEFALKLLPLAGEDKAAPKANKQNRPGRPTQRAHKRNQSRRGNNPATKPAKKRSAR